MAGHYRDGISLSDSIVSGCNAADRVAEFGEIAKIVDITTPRNISLPSHSKREDLGYPIRFELSNFL